MSAQNDLQLIENVVNGLEANPVARFSYTQQAFDTDDADGVDTFDANAGQNIPKAAHTGYSPSVTEKGVRAQGSSIPRMGWNHYIGRLSYNLNKLVQKFRTFVGLYRASLAHNANEYDSSAKYRNGDICYTVDASGGVKVYIWWQRKSQSPETISGIPPSNAAHWTEMQSGTSSSALLPFSAPGYRLKFTVADLTGGEFLTGRYYPVTTGFQDFDVAIPDNARTNGTAEAALQVRAEVYCNGPAAGHSSPSCPGSPASRTARPTYCSTTRLSTRWTEPSTTRRGSRRRVRRRGVGSGGGVPPSGCPAADPARDAEGRPRTGETARNTGSPPDLPRRTAPSHG
jgi:hypothetical protein